ncbi:MAG: ATP-binding protein [Desulfosarcinaceae bacterium]|nr:ATP-binding protein [Desulfosarcinaceae bacterium]
MHTISEEKASLVEKIRILECLYQISELVVEDADGFENTIQRIVDLVPRAFEYPEKVAAAIDLKERRYQTPGFETAQGTVQHPIVVNGEGRGSLAIGCIEEGAFALSTEGTCSIAENNLMAAVAKKVAYMIDRKEAIDRKQLLEEQLMHADRLSTIGQLAAGIAHELNNPLGDILGFAELAANTPDLQEEIYKDLVKIVKSTLYAREIIKKVLYFSRQTHPREATADLNQLIGEWMDFLESRCAKNGIQVALQLDDNLPIVNGDPAQLNQVLINVVVNAIQAMPDGGILTIQTRRKENQVSLVVQDTGNGIEKAVKDNIFLPFFTTKEVDQGTGLGLSVVHGIVQEHGGSIEVASQVGQGTIFTIWLPV